MGRLFIWNGIMCERLEGSSFSHQLAPLDEWIEWEQVREATIEFTMEDAWERAWEEEAYRYDECGCEDGYPSCGYSNGFALRYRFTGGT
jgi:hypothetical protein